MRTKTWLLVLPLLATGCAGPDADPVEVAERFHAERLEGDDRGMYALLTEADRAAMPLDSFPSALPSGLTIRILGLGSSPLDSAALARVQGDTADVALHVSNGAPDTLRLYATHEPRRLLFLELDRVRWRVSMGLAEWTRIAALARSLRSEMDAPDADAARRAREYLDATERFPAAARPADLDLARSTIRRATVADSLRVDLRVSESFMGTHYVSGRIENPTRNRVATLRLIVTDGAGQEEPVELWDIAPGSSTEVSQMTRLRKGEVTHRLARIQVF